MAELQLREISSVTPARVDADQGVIRDCLLLGETSRNTKEGKPIRYTSAARERALHLYEGAAVVVDHLPEDDPYAERSVLTKVGWSENVRNCAEGIRGDVRLNPKMQASEALLWYAEHRPQILGLSHEAWGAGEAGDTHYDISEIKTVEAVAFVDRPGTTKSLFESWRREHKETTGMKLSDLTLAQLQSERPDLLEAAQAKPRDLTVDELKEMLDAEKLVAILADETLFDSDRVRRALAMIATEALKDGKTDESAKPAPKPDKVAKLEREIEALKISRQLEGLRQKRERELDDAISEGLPEAFCTEKFRKDYLGCAKDEDAEEMLEERRKLATFSESAPYTESAPSSSGAGAIKDGKSFAAAVLGR